MTSRQAITCSALKRLGTSDKTAAGVFSGSSRAHEFVFARLRYDSGDWDYNPKVATGHKLVRFSGAERDRLRRFVERGGLLFSDDCNHDVAGLYATSFEQEMRRAFPRPLLSFTRMRPPP